MYSYHLENVNTGKHIIVFGVTLKTAMVQAGLDLQEWECLFEEYED
jgi:hypothetical protein